MELRIDKNKTYAIALEGGGAKGGYEVGVWKALEDSGIKYNAVSGTSVGALNGAMMSMRDLKTAIDGWAYMKMNKVIDLSDDEAEKLQKLLGRDSSNESLTDKLADLRPEVIEIIKNRGLDISPLREWIARDVNPAAIRSSDVELFVTTFCVTDKTPLTIKLNDIQDDEEIYNMILASAYHPTFKQEKLGGKYYTDGGVVDKLPIKPLIDAGYKDIIAVHIPGIGNSRSFKKDENTTIIDIVPKKELGPVLNFDSRQAKRDMEIGYFDCAKVLYGLYGNHYYIDRSLSEREALDLLIDILVKENPDAKLREITELKLPAAIIKSGAITKDYYEILIGYAEQYALKKKIKIFKVYKDTDFIKEVFEQ